MIIGRNKEKAQLSQLYDSKEAEFLVVYGRRRIGKTFLIESFFSTQKCKFFHVTGVQNGRINDQLKEFAKEIGQVFYGGAKIETPATWMQAFEELTTAIGNQTSNKKVVLFFDEFPWMATKRSRLLQALDYYWNRRWKNDKRLKLIICGSSASWIINKIVNNKGGLHNRITQQMHIKSFNLLETKLFLHHRGIQLNNQQVAELYCVMGGIPYYLNQIHKNLSVAQNINKLCFQKEGLLYGEFDNLFTSLFKDSETYEELIRIIARSRHGIGWIEIEKSIKNTRKGGTLTKRLKDLEMAGFIKGFLPVGHIKRGLYYRIIDEYSLFYLQWIEEEKNNIELEIENHSFWLDKIKTAQYSSWCGYVFESLCYKHIAPIKEVLNIKISATIGTWRYTPAKGKNEDGAQIDLLFDRKDDAITLCEIKYSNKPFILDKSYADEINQKIRVFQEQTRTKKQIFVAFIASNGLKPTTYAQELVSATVTLEDLFK